MSAAVPSELEPPSAARRARFRDAVAGLAKRAERTDLVQWVLLPGALAVVVGFLFMLFGWVGAARTARQIEQIPYLISGGLIGLGLVVVGGLLLASTFWVAALRKAQQDTEERFVAHTRAMEERMAELVAQLTTEPTAGRSGSGATPPDPTPDRSSAPRSRPSRGRAPRRTPG